MENFLKYYGNIEGFCFRLFWSKLIKGKVIDFELQKLILWLQIV
jgi:hypothetical protein